MGGSAHIVVVEPGEDALGLARRRLGELDRRWSRFRPDSELSRLNRSEGRWHPVSEDTFRLVQESVAAWRATAGVFDPTVLAILECAGYDRTFVEIDQIREVDAATVPAPGCIGVELDPDTRSIRLPEGVTLDSGGLGKGLAADLVCAELLAAGCAGASVNVGGDVRVAGTPPDGWRWVLGVEDPDRKTLASLAIDEGAIASSSTGVRRWGGWHHIIDPRTGRPAEARVTSASVVAPTAAQAEVLATVLMVAGTSLAAQVAAALGSTSWGALVEEDGLRASLGVWPEHAQVR